MNKLIDSMSVLFVVMLLALNSSCVTVDNELKKPLPEEMPQGRQVCKALCSSYGRDFQEYRPDGKCVCLPK